MESKTYSITVTVTPAQTARAMESGSLKVLATPALIALMEQAACGCAAMLLPEGQTSVGTEVNIRHIAATPVGMQVTATAELIGMEGRTLTFSVKAHDAAGPIGEGTHTRVMVDAERFQYKTDRKLLPQEEA